MTALLIAACLFGGVVLLTVWALEQHEGEDLTEPDDVAEYFDRSP